MKIRNQLEFETVLDLLKKKSYMGRSLQRADLVYSILKGVCSQFDINGVEVFIRIEVDLKKEAETKKEPTGYFFKGRFYQTNTREVTTGGLLGKLSYYFLIEEQEYIIWDGIISFENYSDMPWDMEAGFLSDRVSPKIRHTLEVLKFLREKNLFSTR